MSKFSSIAVALGLLAGCSGNSDEQKTTTEQASTTTTESDSTTTNNDSVTASDSTIDSNSCRSYEITNFGALLNTPPTQPTITLNGNTSSDLEVGIDETTNGKEQSYIQSNWTTAEEQGFGSCETDARSNPSSYYFVAITNSKITNNGNFFINGTVSSLNVSSSMCTPTIQTINQYFVSPNTSGRFLCMGTVFFIGFYITYSNIDVCAPDKIDITICD